MEKGEENTKSGMKEIEAEHVMLSLSMIRLCA